VCEVWKILVLCKILGSHSRWLNSLIVLCLVPGHLGLSGWQRSWCSCQGSVVQLCYRQWCSCHCVSSS
jgi:hypothetical protein